MSKIRCPECGSKVRDEDIRCEDCGAYLKENIVENVSEEKVNIINEVDTDTLEYRTNNNISKLGFVANFIKVVWFVLGILFLLLAFFEEVPFYIIMALVVLISTPFVALPITWMQLMLENLNEINKKMK